MYAFLKYLKNLVRKKDGEYYKNCCFNCKMMVYDDEWGWWCNLHDEPTLTKNSCEKFVGYEKIKNLC